MTMDEARIKAIQLQQLFELSLDMLGTSTPDGYFTMLNPAWTRTLGWTLAALMAEPYISFVHPDDVEVTLRHAAGLAENNPRPLLGFQNRYRTTTGEYRWLEWNVFPSENTQYFVVHDNTLHREELTIQQQKQEILLESQGLVNGLTDSITEGIFAIDHLGRAKFLNAAAQRMLGWTEENLLGEVMHEVLHFERLDGTKLPAHDCPIVQTRATGVSVRVERDVFIRKDGTRVHVSYTSSPLNLKEGFGAVVVFDDITERLAEELKSERELDKLFWIGRIQDALAQDRFVLFAQPIMELRTGQIAQHELFIRMDEGHDELVLPHRFLPAAEEFGLIRDIDQWVVTRSALLAREGHKVGFNLSAKSLDLGMVHTISEAIRSTGAPAGNLVCEITEIALMADNEVGEMFVKGVRDLGCEIVLDDFGVGYGGLAYLKRLPVSYLKIDVQFVADLVEMEASRHVIRAIVDLASGFDIKTIADGAENEETVEVLREMGVDFVQGYVVDAPGPLDEMLKR